MTLIVAIVGLPGSGKTCLQTYLGKRLHANGRKVVTNYRVKFPHTALPSLPPRKPKEPQEEWLQRVHKVFGELQDTLILWDEAHIYVDSRHSSSGQNVLWSYFITQTRKRGVDLLFTTQALHQVDLRLRTLVNMVIDCKDMGQDLTLATLWQPSTTDSGWARGKRMLLQRAWVYKDFDSYQVITGT